MEGLVGTFNQEEGPGRGLFLDCENFADGSFAALILVSPHEVCPSCCGMLVCGLCLHNEM